MFVLATFVLIVRMNLPFMLSHVHGCTVGYHSDESATPSPYPGHKHKRHKGESKQKHKKKKSKKKHKHKRKEQMIDVETLDSQ